MNGKKLTRQVLGAVLCALLWVGCSATPPTSTPITIVTNTPQTKPTLISLPPTSTPSSTQTTTPTVSVTPTGSAGTGNIAGRLVYRASAKPASGYSIGLGTASFSEPFGRTPFNSKSWTKSDKDGYFAFANVTAGEWIVAVDNPLISVLYPWERVTVKAGVTVTVELEQIDKDLKLVFPPNKSTQANKRPTLRWTPYPRASAYKVELHHLSEDGSKQDITSIVLPLVPFGAFNSDKVITDTETTPLQDLPPGWYYWSVTALDKSNNTWAYCDCGGSQQDSNYWTFGIPGEKTLVAWAQSYDYHDKPSLSIYNYAGEDLTLALVGYGTVIVSFDKDTFRPDKELDISPGTYPYTATISRLPPISGTIVIGQKGPQVLKFYVSSSISK